MTSLMGLLCVQGQRYLSLGEVAEPAGNQHPVICPYGIVQAADGPLNISVSTSRMWQEMCLIIGQEDLIEHPDYADNSARLRNRVSLMQILDVAFAKDTHRNWASRLIAAGVPAGPIYTTDQVFTNPHVMATGVVESVLHPTIGQLNLVGNPARLSSLGGKSVHRPPPLLGEHTLEALQAWGIPKERIDGLLSNNVLQPLMEK